MAFRSELEQYGDHVRFFPQDETGLLDLEQLLGEPIENGLIYCCGPGPLLDAVEQRSVHWPPGSLQVERFTQKAVDAEETDRNFEVVLAQRGQTLNVPPEKSILEVLEENGVNLLSSCRSGLCGTCETKVLEGTPDHRDTVLTPEEAAANEYMMVCVSRCVGSRLVLDL